MELELAHDAPDGPETTGFVMELLTLPTELILHILSFLSAQDITHFSSTSRTSHVLVASSPTLSYKLQLYLCKAEDNPKNRLAHREKLKLLRKQTHSWLHCEPNFSITVPVTFDEGSIYDLSGGAYFLGQVERRTLRYIDLPTESNERIDWKVFKPTKNQEEVIIDFTVNRYEHDMICLITGNRFAIGPLGVVYLKLSIYQFSTGNYHPLAKEPVQTIVGPESDWGTPAVYCEIAGDIIVLVTNFRIGVTSPSVTVYHWKTGKVLLRLTGTETYEGVVFLNENTILLPKISDDVLEIWKIPDLDEPSPDFPIRSLHLFDTAPNCSIQYISCRADPNPRAPDTLLNSDRPFHSCADDAIVLLHIWVRRGMLDATLVTLIVHRKALLELSSQSQTQFDFADLVPAAATPWSEWAPAIVLCFDAGGSVSSRWITEACAQRFVYLQGDSEEEGEEERPPATLVILDFDPDKIKEVEKEMEMDGDKQRRDRDMYGPVVRKGPHRFPQLEHRLFSEEVVSYLPYVESRTKEKYIFDGVMLDQERTVGLKTDRTTEQTFVSVLHFG
ncbi:hypothetical protein E1B28_007020 [Marasmius oreades]|uniref:F-box domain-containing protein n=1 Tax=Marasmius oreades TaxID=181124 RepID=A0A9P7S1H4_9AGAR|nr:uncharacterized protein E1B28_007020 [Marasmius oreades]KAG7093340.1 hypothetical protein E1B28_007020 [Marasmius oreades]